MKEIKKLIKSKKDKLIKYFKKKTKNIRYETRYKNLLVKYEELEQSKKEVEDKLNKDKNLKEIDNLRGQVIRLKNVNSNLSRDVRTLEERVKRIKNGK